MFVTTVQMGEKNTYKVWRTITFYRAIDTLYPDMHLDVFFFFQISVCEQDLNPFEKTEFKIQQHIHMAIAADIHLISNYKNTYK